MVLQFIYFSIILKTKKVNLFLSLHLKILVAADMQCLLCTRNISAWCELISLMLKITDGLQLWMVVSAPTQTVQWLARDWKLLNSITCDCSWFGMTLTLAALHWSRSSLHHWSCRLSNNIHWHYVHFQMGRLTHLYTLETSFLTDIGEVLTQVFALLMQYSQDILELSHGFINK